MLVYALFIILIVSGLFKHKVTKIVSSENLPLVSVVVAARNEEKGLPNLIHDLINQEYPLGKLEIIFINDRSTDLTENILEEASENYSFIKNIKIENKSKEITPKKYALTKGIELAKGEVIISTDADCRVGKLWVSSMSYDVIKNNSISIGFSSIKAKTFFDQYQKIDFLGIITANAGAGGWNMYWSGTGQNLAYYKSDFLEINGFEPVKEKISGDEKNCVKKYLQAFRDGDLIKALSELDNLSKLNKQMKDYSSLMRERITELQIIGLPENWEGVYEATSK